MANVTSSEIVFVCKTDSLDNDTNDHVNSSCCRFSLCGSKKTKDQGNRFISGQNRESINRADFSEDVEIKLVYERIDMFQNKRFQCSYLYRNISNVLFDKELVTVHSTESSSSNKTVNLLFKNKKDAEKFYDTLITKLDRSIMNKNSLVQQSTDREKEIEKGIEMDKDRLDILYIINNSDNSVIYFKTDQSNRDLEEEEEENVTFKLPFVVGDISITINYMTKNGISHVTFIDSITRNSNITVSNNDISLDFIYYESSDYAPTSSSVSTTSKMQSFKRNALYFLVSLFINFILILNFINVNILLNLLISTLTAAYYYHTQSQGKLITNVEEIEGDVEYLQYKLYDYTVFNNEISAETSQTTIEDEQEIEQEQDIDDKSKNIEELRGNDGVIEALDIKYLDKLDKFENDKDIKMPFNWIEGCNYNRKEAFKRWKESLEWRKNFEISKINNKISKNKFYTLKSIWNQSFLSLSKPSNDHDTYLVTLERFTGLDKICKNMKASGITPAEFTEYCIFQNEWWIHQKLCKGGKLIKIVDVGGLSIGFSLSLILKYFGAMNKAIQQYPEIMHTMYFINVEKAGTAFRIIFKLLPRFVDPRTMAKLNSLKITNKKDMEFLNSIIDMDKLPKELGGTYEGDVYDLPFEKQLREYLDTNCS